MKLALPLMMAYLFMYVNNSNAQQKPYLNGLWHCQGVQEYYYQALPCEDDPSGYLHRSISYYIFIGKDSVWRIDYPSFRTELGIKIDTSLLSVIDSSHICYSGRYYSKVADDSCFVKPLKYNQINPYFYLGQWCIIREEYFERDLEPITYIFPFEIADTILIEPDMIKDDTISLNIEGDTMSFAYYFNSPNNSWSESMMDLKLVLYPLDSWGEDANMWLTSGEELSEQEKQDKKDKGSGVSKLRLTFKRP